MHACIGSSEAFGERGAGVCKNEEDEDCCHELHALDGAHDGIVLATRDTRARTQATLRGHEGAVRALAAVGTAADGDVLLVSESRRFKGAVRVEKQ